MLSPDTEVTLLLCGRFQESQKGLKPLSPGEWNLLAEHLHEQKLRPYDLVTRVPKGAPIGTFRIQELLGRGAALSLAVERWSQCGLWVASRSDREYPNFWRKRLRKSSPPLLYGVGEVKRLRRGGLAVVGSRDATPEDLAFAYNLGKRCAEQRVVIVSGGARGVDERAMLGSLEAGGEAVGVLSHGLLKQSTHKTWRPHLRAGRLTMVTHTVPTSGFNAGLAMARNKLIYSLAHAAVVAATAEGSGGTWSGALENLRAQWSPLYARPAQSAGSDALITLGARPLSEEVLSPDFSLVSLAQSKGAEELLIESFLELLAEQLRREPLSAEELAQVFGLQLEQIQIWLQRAMKTGRFGQNLSGRFVSRRHNQDESGQLDLI